MEGMTAPPNDQGRLDRISQLRQDRDALIEQAEQVRQQILTEVRAAFPEDQAPPRGTLTRLVEATGWTRAYVADIRDGKVT